MTLKKVTRLMPIDPPSKEHAPKCLHFDGSRRDKTAFLFRIGKGYCEIDGRPGGRWNVVQDIVKPHLCKFFSPAPADLISSRQKLLKKYAQYR